MVLEGLYNIGRLVIILDVGSCGPRTDVPGTEPGK